MKIYHGLKFDFQPIYDGNYFYFMYVLKKIKVVKHNLGFNSIWEKQYIWGFPSWIFFKVGKQSIQISKMRGEVHMSKRLYTVNFS